MKKMLNIMLFYRNNSHNNRSEKVLKLIHQLDFKNQLFLCHDLNRFNELLAAHLIDIIIAEFLPHEEFYFSEILQQVKKQKIIFYSDQLPAWFVVNAIKAGVLDCIELNCAANNDEKRLIQTLKMVYQGKLINTNKESLEKDFFAHIVHEIRSPLNSILGYTSLLIDLEEQPAKKNQLKIIKTSSKYLLDIVNDVLDYSKIKSGTLSIQKMRFILGNTLNHIHDMFQFQAAEKKIEFLRIGLDKLPTLVEGDELRFSQVIINLLSNAFKFTGSEGKITIAYQYLAPVLKIVITDTGIGIANHQLKTIFIAFEQAGQATRQYGGTGLGLAITLTLIQLMKGTISVNSIVGKGTSFTVKIPLAERKPDLPGDGNLEPLESKNDDQAMVERWLQAIGERAEIRKLLLKAIRQLPERIAEIAAAIDQKDWTNLKNHVHKLKGYTGSYKMEEIYLKAKQMDLIVKKDPVEMQSVVSLFNQIKAVVQAIPEKYFYLPHEADEVKLALSSDNAKILIADDSPENQNLLKAYLNKINLSCKTVKNGKEAIKEIAANQFEILFLDMQMPVMDGFSTLKYLNQKPDLKKKLFIIALTADSTQATRAAILDLGVDYYLTKPIELEDIQKAIYQFNFSK